MIAIRRIIPWILRFFAPVAKRPVEQPGRSVSAAKPRGDAVSDERKVDLPVWRPAASVCGPMRAFGFLDVLIIGMKARHRLHQRRIEPHLVAGPQDALETGFVDRDRYQSSRCRQEVIYRCFRLNPDRGRIMGIASAFKESFPDLCAS